MLISTPSVEGFQPIVATEHSDFDEFFNATWPRMFRVAYGISGDAGTAEDAAQAAYARAFSYWDRVRATEQPAAYLRRMVVNEVLGARRYGWSRRESAHEQIPMADSTPSPEDQVVERSHLWAAVQTLPPRQRAVVVLRYYEELSEAEIADVLGCSRGTVKSQASKALASLRQVSGLQIPSGDEA